MDKSYAYNRYKNVKDKLDYSYKGYNLKNLVSGWLDFVFDGITPTSKDLIKQLLKCRAIPDLRKVPQAKASVAITYLINRQDYKNLAYAAKEIYPKAEVIDISSLPVINYSFFNLSFLKFLFKSFGIINGRKTGLPLISKLYLAASLTKIFLEIKLLEDTTELSKIEKYICFNSAYREESLLTEYFNKRNIETITLQHGIFCEFKRLIPFDYINFENFIAKKMFCWGQSTVDFLTDAGIDQTRLIITGNLKYKNIRIDKVPQTFKSCLVLPGRGLYIDTNNKLLQVLTDYNKKHNSEIRFYIKKHPFLLDEEHRQFADVLNNIIFLGKEHSTEEVLKSDLVDFSIAVNTTAYYESLAIGKACFRWTEAENELFFGMDDKFENLSQLEEKLQIFKAKQPEEITKEMQDVIKYVFNTQLK